MTQRTRDAYQRWAPTYDSDPNPQTALEVDDVLSALALAAGARILDAGYGTGRYFSALWPMATVVGCDFARAMLTRAHAKFPTVPLVLADLSIGLPFRGASFTHVLCAQTLKHCRALSTPVQECFRVLCPGGVFVFSVTHPDMDFTDYELCATPGFILSREADIFHHTREDYWRALHTAGFRSVTVRDVVVCDKIAHFLTPTSYRRVRGRPQVAVFRAEKPPKHGLL